MGLNFLLHPSLKRTVYAGGTSIAAEAGLNAIPIFALEGAIIPGGGILRANNNWDDDWPPRLNIEVFPSSKSPGKFEYFTGTEVRTITATAMDGGFVIQFPDLGVSGTLEIYCGSVAGVTPNGAALRQGGGLRVRRAHAEVDDPLQRPHGSIDQGHKSIRGLGPLKVEEG
jgi:hypothetical protein